MRQAGVYVNKVYAGKEALIQESMLSEQMKRHYLLSYKYRCQTLSNQ